MTTDIAQKVQCRAPNKKQENWPTGWISSLRMGAFGPTYTNNRYNDSRTSNFLLSYRPQPDFLIARFLSSRCPVLQFLLMNNVHPKAHTANALMVLGRYITNTRPLPFGEEIDTRAAMISGKYLQVFARRFHALSESCLARNKKPPLCTIISYHTRTATAV